MKAFRRQQAAHRTKIATLRSSEKLWQGTAQRLDVIEYTFGKTGLGQRLDLCYEAQIMQSERFGLSCALALPLKDQFEIDHARLVDPCPTIS